MKARTFGRLAATVGAIATVAAAQIGVQLVAAAPASALPGLQVVSAISPFNSLASKSITATCPAGKKVVGGGGRVNGGVSGGNAKVGVTELRPFTGASDGFAVTGFESDNGFAGSWSVQAYAICANPVAGYQLVTNSNTPSSSSFQLTGVACPSGKRVIGAGARINNPAGQVSLQANNTDNPLSTQATAAGYEDIDGFAGNWGLTSYAICIPNPVAGFTIASAASANNSDISKIVNVTCPGGTKVHGISFSTGAGNGDPILEALVPSNAVPSGAQVIVREETGTAENWSVMVQAICAN